MRKEGFWLLVAGVVVGLGPVGLAMLAGLVASAAGCTLNEATAHPCVIGGVDIGGALYFVGVMGWLSLATLPIGGMVFLAGLVVLILGFLRRAK